MILDHHFKMLDLLEKLGMRLHCPYTAFVTRQTQGLNFVVYQTSAAHSLISRMRQVETALMEADMPPSHTVESMHN